MKKIACLMGLILLGVTQASFAAQAVKSGEITSVSPSTFLGGESKTVSVYFRSSNGSGNVVIEADSWPSGWSVSPKNRNPTINQGTTYSQSFTVTAPSGGGSGTIQWKFYDDDYGVHPSGSHWLDTYNQSVSATALKPDIICQNISLSSPLVAGQSATITASVKNQGNANAGSFKIKYYVGGSYIGEDTLSLGLNSGSSDNESISYTASSSGSKEVRVFVDSSYNISESNESNNNRYETHSWAAPPKPDIICQNISLSSPLVAGQSATITASVKNQGNANAGSFKIKYYVDGSYIGDDTLSYGLNSGSSDNESISYTASSSGNHEVRVFVDSSYNVSESNESNNNRYETHSWATPPKPDLICQTISVTSPRYAGEAATITATMKNQGNANAGSFKIKYYVDGSYIGEDTLSLGLNSGSSDNESISYTAASSGSKSIRIDVDTASQVSESNEGNNSKTQSFTWDPPPQPDLIVRDIATSASSAYPGQSIGIDSWVKNQGNANASQSRVKYWFGRSAGEKWQYIGDGLVPNLGSLVPGAEEKDSIGSYTIPDVASGTYYFVVEADADGGVSESNEGNNIRSEAFTITAVPKPDLIVRDIQTSLSNAHPGQSIQIDSWVKNQGNANAAQSRVKYYLGRSTGEKWQYIGDGLVPNLGSLTPGEEEKDSISSYDIPHVSDGDYYVVVEADSDGEISESDEGNNIRSEILTIANVVGAKITAFVPQTGVVNYETSATASITVENTGTLSRTYWVGLSFSGPDAGSWESQEGWLDVPPQETGILLPGETQTFVFSYDVTHKLAPGQHIAYAAVWDGYDETDDLMVEPRYDHKEENTFIVSGNYPAGTDDDPYGLLALDAGGFYANIPIGNRGDLSDLEDHIANPLQDVKTEADLDSSNNRVVVLIHGWNPDKRVFGFGSPPSGDPLHTGDWPDVTSQLEGSKLNSEWSLVEYDWHNDAQTGFGFIGEPAAAELQSESGDPEALGDLVTIVRLALIVQSMAAEWDAAEAAERAYAHGIVLGKNLVDQIGASNLKQVQLVGHSAGSWGVYAALRYISQHAPECEVQVAFLDPYIPNEAGFFNLPTRSHSFSSAVLENCVNYTRVSTPGAAEAEAYYTTEDFTEVFSLLSDATTVKWTWDSVPSAYVKRTGFGEIGTYSGHGGPIKFYGHSVADPALPAVLEMGWNYSLAFNTTVGRVIRLAGDIAFGDVLSGSSSDRTLTIHNDGNDPLGVTGISLPSGFSGDWSGTVVPSGSREVTITFSPSALQDYSGTVSVSSDATSGTNTRDISGRGIGRVIRLAGDLAFGDVAVDGSEDRTLTIHNDGNVDLSVSELSVPDGFSGDWSGTVSAEGSRDVTITFSPSAAGSYSGDITVSSDKTSGTNTRGVSGTGMGSTISLSGNLSFGAVEVGESDTRTLTIHNDGSAELNVSGIDLPAGFSGDWFGSISGSGFHDVSVTFSPMGGGAYSGSASVNSDAQSGTSIRAVSGTGTITQSLDSDGDGICDAHEAIAGTEKGDKNSYFQVAAVETLPNGGFKLQWASVSGRKYNVLFSTSLESGFAYLSTGIDANPPLNTYTDDVARGKAFYLIEVYVDE